jgi:hypothetical protein
MDFEMTISAIQCNIELIAGRVKFMNVEIPFYTLVSRHPHKVVVLVHFFWEGSLLSSCHCHYFGIFNQNSSQLKCWVEHVEVGDNDIKVKQTETDSI